MYACTPRVILSTRRLEVMRAILTNQRRMPYYPLVLHSFSTINSTDSTKTEKKSVRVTQIHDISSKSTKRYVYFDGISDVGREVKENSEGYNNSFSISMFHKATKYFLPRGYPYSVAPGYLQFATGQSLSIMFSTIGGVLSMQSLLYAMGLSSPSAVVGGLAGSLNWVLKDGLGQLGGVLFASVVSNKFDADPKKWRFMASIFMDLSSFIELLSPLAPRFFLLIASVANVGKNIAYLAASASRAAIHKSFDIHENMADITAKTGSQSIVSSMVGTTIGIAVAAHLGNPWAATTISTAATAAADANSDIAIATSNLSLSVLDANPWLQSAGVFVACSALSLMATNWALKHVTVRTLTPQRLDLIIDHFYCNSPSAQLLYKSDIAARNILSPSQFSNIEKSVFKGYFQGNRRAAGDAMIDVYVNEEVNKVISSYSDLKVMMQMYEGKKYFIKVTKETTGAIKIYLSFLDSADKKDVLHGLIHAYLIKNELIHLDQLGKLEKLDQYDGLCDPKSSFLYIDDSKNIDSAGSEIKEEIKLSLVEYIYDRLSSASDKSESPSTIQESKADKDQPHTSSSSNIGGLNNPVNYSLGKTDSGHLKWILDEMMLEPKFARINIKKDN